MIIFIIKKYFDNLELILVNNFFVIYGHMIKLMVHKDER